MFHTGPVLYDVGESIEEMLRTRCGIPQDVEIVFEAPTRDWASRRSAPAVDVFLYDIRENLDRRQNLLEFTRDEHITTGRVPPTRWYSCSYLITAWTQRPEDEHRLLGSVIEGLLTVHAVPPDCLRGRLASMEREVFMTLGRPLGSERSISDIWSALGGELKPSLDLVVAVPFEPLVSLPVGPPVLETAAITVGVTRDEDGPGSARGAKGRGRAAGSAGEDRPVRTPGHVRLKEQAGERLRPSLIDQRGTEGEGAPVEEVVGGTREQPGRRFRLSIHEPKRGD